MYSLRKLSGLTSVFNMPEMSFDEGLARGLGALNRVLAIPKGQDDLHDASRDVDEDVEQLNADVGGAT